MGVLDFLIAFLSKTVVNEDAKIFPPMYLLTKLFDLEIGAQARRDHEVPVSTWKTAQSIKIKRYFNFLSRF